VSDDRALVEIQRLAQLDRIVYSDHARTRMVQRNARPRDVRNALLTATAAVWQADRQNWRAVDGVDLDGDELTVVVDIWADLVVVTIF
jgi:hypothetical protein